MKKMNKKGFTLAELLIVIAIIAVLIAIAIPTFSGALENARLQTDHANIRSAYGMMMVGEMQGFIETASTTTDVATLTSKTTWYFQKDGTLIEGDTGKAKATAYVTQADGTEAKCSSSAGCSEETDGHKKTKVIGIEYTPAVTSGGSTTPASWKIVFVDPT